MGKPKQRQLGAKPENSIRIGYGDSSKSDLNAELLGEDGWVAVKIQRVTILVPSLAMAEKSIVQNPSARQPQPGARNLTNTETNPSVEAASAQPEFPEEPCRNILQSVDEHDKIILQDSGIVSHAAREAQFDNKVAKPVRQEFKIGSENPDGGCSHIGKLNRPPSVSRTIKLKHLKLSCGPRLLDRNMLLKQMLRASNLERKLQKAGGLSRWLVSIGLGEFVRILQGKGISSKFQLANLTMEKLKNMGAMAVGRRRKLIHAIDRVCQPYGFGAP